MKITFYIFFFCAKIFLTNCMYVYKQKYERERKQMYSVANNDSSLSSFYFFLQLFFFLKKTYKIFIIFYAFFFSHLHIYR